MEEFTTGNVHYLSNGQAVGIINGKGYGASNIYVIRSNNYLVNPPGSSQIVKPTTPPPNSNPWFEARQLKGKKRILTYKLYAVEGKVKNSFKNGFRWIKLTCRNIVHGY